MTNKKNSKALKPTFHPRNKHQARYDFDALVTSTPELLVYIIENPAGEKSINFFDSQAVKFLNKALLKLYYNYDWDIPENYLCPPIPGRADYIHHLADLVGGKNKLNSIKCLDIGVGANCIYPIIGSKEYGWSFVGSDIDGKALESVDELVRINPELSNCLEVRLQSHSNRIFRGIIKREDFFDVTLCNPPFHSSAEEAQKGTKRKLKNLTGKSPGKASLNFGGKSNELWCDGGELEFVKTMILESQLFASSCTWFTTLISKESNLKQAYRILKQVKPSVVKTIPMGQGQKQSRILAWSFSEKELF